MTNVKSWMTFTYSFDVPVKRFNHFPAIYTVENIAVHNTSHLKCDSAINENSNGLKYRSINKTCYGNYLNENYRRKCVDRVCMHVNSFHYIYHATTILCTPKKKPASAIC